MTQKLYEQTPTMGIDSSHIMNKPESKGSILNFDRIWRTNASLKMHASNLKFVTTRMSEHRERHGDMQDTAE